MTEPFGPWRDNRDDEHAPQLQPDPCPVDTETIADLERHGWTATPDLASWYADNEHSSSGQHDESRAPLPPAAPLLPPPAFTHSPAIHLTETR